MVRARGALRGRWAGWIGSVDHNLPCFLILGAHVREQHLDLLRPRLVRGLLHAPTCDLVGDPLPRRRRDSPRPTAAPASWGCASLGGHYGASRGSRDTVAVTVGRRRCPANSRRACWRFFETARPMTLAQRRPGFNRAIEARAEGAADEYDAAPAAREDTERPGGRVLQALPHTTWRASGRASRWCGHPGSATGSSGRCMTRACRAACASTGWRSCSSRGSRARAWRPPLGLYHLLADGEPGAQVAVAATDRAQAHLIFEPPGRWWRPTRRCARW